MIIAFSNLSTMHWLARKGPAKVFGRDVDAREAFTDEEAVAHFTQLWKTLLEPAVKGAVRCDTEFARRKLPYYAHAFISEDAEHREFTLATCFFICQLSQSNSCDQLWFVPSASGDPRTLYVKFNSVPVKEAFDEVAKRIGWAKPEDLAQKLLVDFMESVTRSSYHTAEDE